ncbi:hypothetical protein SALBM135S_04052 [Streptomyces alboniger]
MTAAMDSSVVSVAVTTRAQISSAAQRTAYARAVRSAGE